MAPSSSPLADVQRLKYIFKSSTYTCTMWLCLLVFLFLSNLVASQSIIKTLPGFAGELPFKLETGYIGAGEMDEVQLFYYFIESGRSPKDDPLMLWLTGGPGCSGFSALVYEIGPLSFNYANSSGNKPRFLLNPYSWTKVANIIFLDAPVGTGFSYANNSEGYNTGDTLSAAQTNQFLRKWLMTHSTFLSNPLYVSGDSYTGIVLPIIVQEIWKGNEIGLQPLMNLKGYVLGNPFTDVKYDLNSRVKFAHQTALISDELYKSTKTNCKGEYMRPDPSNAACIDDLQRVTECISKVQQPNILEPKCSALSPKPTKLWGSSSLSESYIDILTSTPQAPGPWCRNYNYLFCYIWANDKTVQTALHVREGTITDWERCNKSLTYAHDIITSIEYQRNLTKKDLRALVYRFVTIYSEKKYSLTFATVKGGGHTTPEYKPKETLAMMEMWFAYYLI
ncbi:serine carboxypeptidase-like 18 isoform X2 [Quercus lobata]|uniref:serine carboxypeptidase-like 18 isoform X2 n=1 Tax=Quercus lobata TaxID=97700 RepID=UPI001245047A|nr:serine carboxypeptidase-like 18 isoform X2 [Quercus lobata]